MTWWGICSFCKRSAILGRLELEAFTDLKTEYVHSGVFKDWVQSLSTWILDYFAIV